MRAIDPAGVTLVREVLGPQLPGSVVARLIEQASAATPDPLVALRYE